MLSENYSFLRQFGVFFSREFFINSAFLDVLMPLRSCFLKIWKCTEKIKGDD